MLLLLLESGPTTDPPPTDGPFLSEVPPAEWVLVLADHTGAEIAAIDATATLRFELSRASHVEITLPHDEPTAAYLYAALGNGLPQLRAYRNGILVFSGRWAPSTDDSGETDSSGKVRFRSPFATLESRFTAATVTYTAQDAGLIATDLIATTNIESPTGLIPGLVQATVNRDRTYEHKQIAEAIQQLTEVDGGFDFLEVPLDPTESGGALARLDIVASAGASQPSFIRFEKGPGTLDNCVSVNRQMLLPVNRATVIGAEGVAPQTVQDTGSITTYGLHATVQSFADVTETATLLAKATALLQTEPPQVVTFTPDPASAPQPLEDYQLGDVASFKCDEDALQIAVEARVRAIEVDLDESGREAAHRVEWGDQRPVRDVDVIREMRSRLSAMERTT